MISNIAFLTGSQKSFVDKFSQLVIRESSDLANTSSNSNLSDWQRDDMNYIARMSRSKVTADKRLLDLYKLRRAETRKSIQEIKAEELAE